MKRSVKQTIGILVALVFTYLMGYIVATHIDVHAAVGIVTVLVLCVTIWAQSHLTDRFSNNM